MTDQCVVPIDEIQRAVGPEFEIARTEVSVAGLNQILTPFSFDRYFFFEGFILFDTEETDRVGVKIVALYVIREVA